MSYNYNPIPPRVWSRVQNPCTFTIPGSDYTQAFIPLTGQTVSQAQADYETKQIYKGNILQYKGNSARLTKSQKYSQLARCAGPNRTKVFATQSETYTNPNTTGLLRVGTQTYPYPNQIVGAPNNISGPFEYNIPNPNDCSGNSVQDGGILVCGTYANPCSGEIIRQGRTNATICNPASASNVPGTSVLCWNNKVQTWFPRQRYFMNNSTDKWPQGYKGFESALRPPSPYITSITFNPSTNTITLDWIQPISCYPIINFYVYENNELIDILPATVFSLSLFRNEVCFYEYYIISAFSNDIFSNPSNVVNINLLDYIINPVISGCLYTIAPTVSVVLNWTAPIIYCNNPLISYTIYYSDGINNFFVNVGNVLNTAIEDLTINKIYSFYVVAILSNGYITSPSNIISISTTYQPFSYTGNPLINGFYDSTNKLWSLVFTSPLTSTGTITFTENINSDIFTLIVGGGGGGGLNSSGNPSGGEGGYQAINTFTGITNGSIFTITNIGAGGTNGGGGIGSGPGTVGGNTSFTGPDLNTYTVTGGFPGQTSGGQVNGASYIGPLGTDTYTGSGGFGGQWSGTCQNTNGWGGNSYLFTNSGVLINLTGGGGGTGGTIGGEGGGQIGNGTGGASSCSLNLNTQDAYGYGGGGAGYRNGSINPPDRAGNGKQGLFILFFSYPYCNPNIITQPGQPTNLSGIVGIESVNLSWNAPLDDGGSPITNYIIYYNYSSITVGNVTSYNLTGLTGGILYVIYIAAINVVGEGPFSSIIYKIPLSVPDPPTNLSGTPGDQQISLSWIAPSNNGGSSITNYIVYYSTDNITFSNISTGSTSTSYILGGLTNGTLYYIYVTAVNVIGESSNSNIFTEIPYTIPSAPINLSGTFGNQQISLSWNAPSNNGGKPITNYIVYYSTDNITFSNISTGSTSTSYILGGLTNGTLYYIYVSAENIAGEGPGSTPPIQVTPLPNPSPPQNLTGSNNLNGYIIVTWDPPANTGDSVLAYYQITVEYTDNLPYITIYNNLTYTNTSFDSADYGITTDGNYLITLTAQNINGYVSTPVTCTASSLGP